MGFPLNHWKRFIFGWKKKRCGYERLHSAVIASYSIIWSHAIIIIPWMVCVYSTQLLLTYYVCSCVYMLSSYGGYPTASCSILILNQGNKHSKLTHIIIYDKPYVNYYYNLKVKLENKQIRPCCIWCTRRTQIHVNKVSIMNSWIQGIKS